MPFKLLNPRNPRQLGPVQWPTGHDQKACLEDIAAISGDRSAPCLVIPARLFDLGLEAGTLIEVEVLANTLGMLKDLWLKGVLLFGDVPSLFQQGQIHVRFDVTLGTRIPVPVPGPAKIPVFLDDAQAGDPTFLQSRCGQETAKAQPMIPT